MFIYTYFVVLTKCSGKFDIKSYYCNIIKVKLKVKLKLKVKV